MNSSNIKRVRTTALLLPLALLTACTTGLVKTSSDAVLDGVEVVAHENCSGAGCSANEVQTAVPAGMLTGYRTNTGADGRFFYDSYGEVVAPDNAMTIGQEIDGAANTYKLKFSKAGYQDTWLDYTPDFKKHIRDGKAYLVTEVPDVFLCAVDEPDTDGDGICDQSEAMYGTSALHADTDGDGEYDDEELFGTGSPFAVSTRKLLHYNINVSDFAASKDFYQMLGFKVLLEVDVDVADPLEAQGLNLPPYSLHAAPMVLGDGFIIDLIQFASPYDPESPHTDIYDLGLATLSLKTDNLQADINALEARGIPYSVFMQHNETPVVIRFADPDGTVILLTQVTSGQGINSSGETYVYGVLSTNINVSDYDRAIEFYQKIGFRVTKQENGIATIALQDGRHFTLTESTDHALAYEDVNHLGIARIAIETSNIDKDIQVLKENNVEFYTEAAIVPSGPLSILRYVCFEDPDGTVIELVQYND